MQGHAAALHGDLLHRTCQTSMLCVLWGQDVTRPSVTVMDPDSRQSLCTYRLEEQPQHVLATHSSVTMCRLFPSMCAGPPPGAVVLYLG